METSRLGRLRVTTTPDGQMSTQTTNISVFSLNPDVFRAACDAVGIATIITIDGDNTPIDFGDLNDTILFARDTSTTRSRRKSPWRVGSLLDAR